MPAERASRNSRSRMRSCSSGFSTAPRLMVLMATGRPMFGIDGVIHHAHGPAPEFPDDFVSPDAVHSVLVITHGEMARAR